MKSFRISQKIYHYGLCDQLDIPARARTMGEENVDSVVNQLPEVRR